MLFILSFEVNSVAYFAPIKASYWDRNAQKNNAGFFLKKLKNIISSKLVLKIVSDNK